MHTMKRIGAAVAYLLSTGVQAHPGHPALSIEHTHAAYEIDPLLGLMLIVAVGAMVVLVRAFRRRRNRATRR